MRQSICTIYIIHNFYKSPRFTAFSCDDAEFLLENLGIISYFYTAYFFVMEEVRTPPPQNERTKRRIPKKIYKQRLIKPDPGQNRSLQSHKSVTRQSE